MPAAYREFPPPAELRPYVECFWLLTAPADGSAWVERILPDGCIDVVALDSAALLVGPSTRVDLVSMGGGASTAGARFRPGAAPGLVGLPADAIRDLKPTLAEVWGSRGRDVQDRLTSSTGPERIDLLRAMLLQRLPKADAPDPLVQALVPWLGTHRDPVQQLAHALGIGERQLRRRVEAAVGYGPKRLARVLRLRRFLARGPHQTSLAELAVVCGYFDQAHMSHEVASLTGLSPSALFARHS